MISFFSRLVVGLAIIGMLGFSASLAASEVGEGEINNPSWDSDNEAPDGDFQDDNALHTDIDKGELSPDGAEVKGQDFSDTIESDPINGTDPMDPLVDPAPDDGPEMGENENQLEEWEEAAANAEANADASGKEGGGGSGDYAENAGDVAEGGDSGLQLSVDGTSGRLHVAVPLTRAIPLEGGGTMSLTAIYLPQTEAKTEATVGYDVSGEGTAPDSKEITLYNQSYNKLIQFGAHWQFAESAMLYIKRDYRTVTDGEVEENIKYTAWYDYFEASIGGSMYRFYSDTSKAQVHECTYDDGKTSCEWKKYDGLELNGQYAAAVYDPAWDCTMSSLQLEGKREEGRCTVDFKNGQAHLYTRDGSNLRLTWYKDSGLIRISFPNGEWMDFNQGGEGLTSISPSQIFGDFHIPYHSGAVRYARLVTQKGSYQREGGRVEYFYSSSILTDDELNYCSDGLECQNITQYTRLDKICDWLDVSHSRCIDVSSISEDGAGKGTMTISYPGYQGQEMRTTVLLDSGNRDIEFVHYPDDNGQKRQIEFDYNYKGLSKVFPIHDPDKASDLHLGKDNNYYEIDYVDDWWVLNWQKTHDTFESYGISEEICASEAEDEDGNTVDCDSGDCGDDICQDVEVAEGSTVEVSTNYRSYTRGQVSTFTRIVGGERQATTYAYDNFASSSPVSTQSVGNTEYTDDGEPYSVEHTIEYYSADFYTVTITDPKGNQAVNKVSLVLSRFPFTSSQGVYPYSFDPIFTYEMIDVPFENLSIGYAYKGSFMAKEYPDSPQGRLLRSEYYTLDSGALVLRTQTDYGYSRAWDNEDQGRFQDIFRLVETVSLAIGDDGTETISREHFSYDDAYGRLTRTELYSHESEGSDTGESDYEGTLIKDTKQSYATLVDESHWFCGDSLLRQVKEKEFNASSPYYDWPHHDGYVQILYQWFDFDYMDDDKNASAVLRAKQVGDPDAEDGAQNHHYSYSEGEGESHWGQLEEMYWILDGGESEDGHHTVSPRMKYSYGKLGVPIKDEVMSMSGTLMTKVDRVIDPYTGLVQSETYFDGSKKDFKYDSLGRPVQVLTWSAPTESSSATLLTVGNMEYRDLGATVISWTDTSASPLYLEPEAIPVFEARYDGHFDQWAKSYSDLFGRVVKEETLGPRGSATESEYPILKKKFVYDEKDRIVQSTDFNSGAADGNVNKIEYDELGRVWWQHSSTGVEISYHYPTPLTKIVDRVVTDQILERKYSYDVRGRLIKVTETLPEGSDWYDSDDLNEVEYRYDYADRMIEAVSNDGEQTRKWTYSTAGVLLESVYPEDAAPGVDSSDDLLYTTKLHQQGACGPEIWSDATERKVQNRYNSWCEITSTVDPETGNPYLNLTYDSKHRLDTKTNYQDELDESRIQEKFYYDAGNNIEAVNSTIHYRDNPSVIFTTRYRYDKEGRLRSLVYPYLYKYDDIYYEPKYHGFAYSYDASGAPARILRGDFNSDLTVISNVALSGQWDFSYEPTWGGLKQYVFNKGTSSVTLNRTFDGVGRLQSYGATVGNTTISSGTRSSLSTPTTSSTMKPKTAKQKTGGTKIGQTGRTSPSLNNPDQMPAPVSTTSNTTPITLFSGTYGYDVSGLLTSIGTTDELLQGKIHSRKLYGYDRLGRLTAAWYNKNRGGNDRNIWKEFFNYDRNGNLSDRADDSAAYRLVFMDGTEKLGRFGVDRSKNRVASTLFDGKSTYYEYNATGTVSSIEKYYEITQEFSYTPFNQLYAYDDHEANLSAEYLYNSSGLRIVKRVLNKDTDHEEILYTLYAAGLGSQQLATFKQSGSGSGAVPQLTERLFYTPLGLAYREEVMSPSYSTFSIPNHLGEVKFVVKESDRNWCARETLAYGDPLPEEAEAYLTVEKNCVAMMEGNVKDQLIPHEFGTHAKDIESNLSYMHLRFYDSTMKRFNSPDPMYDINPYKPQSWNRYTYVSNNPVGGIDPTGGEDKTGKESGDDFYQDKDGNWYMSSYAQFDLPSPAEPPNLEIATAFGEFALSMAVPLYGEVMDVKELMDSNAPLWSRGLAGVSLSANAVSYVMTAGTLSLPNWAVVSHVLVPIMSRRGIADAVENLIASGRKVIGEIPWSRGAAKAAEDLMKGVESGAKDVSVHVPSRSEAEELFMGLSQGTGIPNSSHFGSASEAKDFFGSQGWQYHWDDVRDPDTGLIRGHAPDYGPDGLHAKKAHLELHNRNNTQKVFIFFNDGL